MNALRISLLKRFGVPGMHWVWVSLVMYAIACCLPALSIDVETTHRGWFCLVYGTMFAGDALVHSLAHASLPPPIVAWWLANPLFFLAAGAYGFRRPKTSAALASMAVIPAMHFEFVSSDELLPGCVMWVASLQVMALNAIWQVWVDRQSSQTTEVPLNVN